MWEREIHIRQTYRKLCFTLQSLAYAGTVIYIITICTQFSAWDHVLSTFSNSFANQENFKMFISWYFAPFHTVTTWIHYNCTFRTIHIFQADDRNDNNNPVEYWMKKKAKKKNEKSSKILIFALAKFSSMYEKRNSWIFFDFFTIMDGLVFRV